MAAAQAFWVGGLAALVVALVLWALAAPLARWVLALASLSLRAALWLGARLKRPLLNLAGGGAVATLVDLLFAPDLHVGWNLWNLLVLSLLGVPGALLLVAVERWPF